MGSENDYNEDLKYRRPRVTTSSQVFLTVNTFDESNNTNKTGSPRVTSKGRELAMEQLRNSKPIKPTKSTVIQQAKADAMQEVDDEIAARQRVDEQILKIFQSTEIDKELGKG